MDRGGSAHITAAVVAAAARRVLAGEAPDGAKGVKLLERLLRDPSRDVRADAAEMLGRLGPIAKDAVPSLIEALDEQDGRVSVAWYAAIALRRMGPTAAAALERLEKIVSAPKTKANLRDQARQAIDLIDRRRSTALSTAIRCVDGADPIAAFGAARCLRELGPDAAKAVPALIRALKRHTHRAIRYEIVGALGAIGGAAAPALPELDRLGDVSKPGTGPWHVERAARSASQSIRIGQRRRDR